MPRTPLVFAPDRWALLVIDVQRYYLEPEASFVRYFERHHPGITAYLNQRCQEVVLPNLERLIQAFREWGSSVCYLRLCGEKPDRSDLHPNFQETHRQAERRGFKEVYPLTGDPFSEVHPRLLPAPGDAQFCKTTYSGFTTSDLGGWLQRMKVETLVLTGLATSQCVETTARDAADRGYRIVHLEDAQADYEEVVHRASLYSSAAMCGGHIYTTDWLLSRLRAL